MKIWVVDAFADRPFAGGQAAVFVVDDFPDDKNCQKIAAELDLPMTAFVQPLGANTFHIRWFSPKTEYKLCGHATLASSHIIHQEKLVSGKDIIFKSLSGTLKVHSSSSSNYTLDFPLARSEEAFKPSEKCNFGKIVEAVQIEDDIVVELASAEQVENYVPPMNELRKIDCRVVIITSNGFDRYDFVSRCFAPRGGVYEDPVCASAHCKLSFYWQKRLRKSDFVAYQASARGAVIPISIVGDRVHLSGKAVTVLAGEWQVSCQ